MKTFRCGASAVLASGLFSLLFLIGPMSQANAELEGELEPAVIAGPPDYVKIDVEIAEDPETSSVQQRLVNGDLTLVVWVDYQASFNGMKIRVKFYNDGTGNYEQIGADFVIAGAPVVGTKQFAVTVDCAVTYKEMCDFIKENPESAVQFVTAELRDAVGIVAQDNNYLPLEP